MTWIFFDAFLFMIIYIINGHNQIIKMKKAQINRNYQSNKQNSLNSSAKSIANCSLAPNFSKYKFIPPSKILQNKNAPKTSSFNSSKQPFELFENQQHKAFKIKKKCHHYQSLTEPDMPNENQQQQKDIKYNQQKANCSLQEEEDDLTSPLKMNRNFNKKRSYKLLNNSVSHKCLQNYDEIIRKKEQYLKNNNVGHKKMFRSVSHTKLSEVQRQNNSKKNKKTEKTPKKFNNKALTTNILQPNHSLQNQPPKQESPQQAHIQKLTKFIEELRIKQQKYLQNIDKLQHSNTKLIKKIQQLENLHRELDKKEKIIHQLNQKLKENELKANEKCQEHSIIIESLKKIILSQKTKINQLEKVNHIMISQEIEADSWAYDEDSPDKDKFMMTVVGSDHQDSTRCMQTTALDKNPQINSSTQYLKSTTPSFGIGTPDGSREIICETNQEDLDEDSELMCSRQDNCRLQQLSRIQQSAQFLQESSMTEEQNRRISNRRREQQNQPLQHQQLLNEIDQYLQKWNKKR